MTKKFALVTGGAKNIGADICQRLTEDGFEVILLDIVKPVHTFFRSCYQVDLSDTIKAKQILISITKKYEICHLVNNVGVVRPARIDETKIDEFNKIFNINTRPALIVLQALLPSMKKLRHGRVVSIASRVILGKELRTSYSASKGALVAMTRTWALELARHGITVNCVAPGPVETSAFWQNNPKDEPHTASIIESVPVKRLGTGKDVAHAVSFFLNERSSFVTGQTLYVCGGLTVGFSNF